MYLGKKIARDGAIFPEVKKNVLGWAAFGKVYSLMRSPNSTTEIKLFNEYVLAVMTYGSDIWALNTICSETLAVFQRKMDRIMAGVTLRDRKSHTFDSRLE